MSLELYRGKVVTLPTSATVYEAARAMEEHHVGVVFLGAAHGLAGVLTDRDIVLEVVGAGLDPKTTRVADVMSAPVASVAVTAEVSDAARVMHTRGCRRVPLVEDGKVVGLVTMELLLADGAIGIDALRDIVQGQLEGPLALTGVDPGASHAVVREARARARHRARADRAYTRLVRAVERGTGLPSREDAEVAMLIVIRALCLRVTPDEAKHLIAQLPSKLHAELKHYLSGPDREVTTQTITEDLSVALSLDEDSAGEVMALVCEVLAGSVSFGEIASLRDQLPAAMKELFPLQIRRAV